MLHIRKITYYIFPLLLVLILPLILINSQKIQKYLSKAQGLKANIQIDVDNSLGPITPFWRSFAQGGEESNDMIAPVITQVSRLHPQYIRIDHIYDHFNLVSRNSEGQIMMNFSELDKIIGSIRKTGAIPFISLSYMPTAIAVDGNITNQPVNWNDWSYVIKQIIEHYSGFNNLNIKDVYYEVWNEPDLFGNWKTYGTKNYLTLYQYAVQGASQAQNVQAFKIGGPATTALYENWIKDLAKFVTDNKLRLDFFSWHYYSHESNELPQKITDMYNWLKTYPRLLLIPKIISEWGINSENTADYDESISAAHTIAVVRNSFFGISQLFAFELVDGPSPHNLQFWGRWGLLTHPTQGNLEKPRYQAFLWLNQIQGFWLKATGEGTHVQVLSSKDDKNLYVLLTNYDQDKINTENVPVTIKNIPNGNYSLNIQRLGLSLTTDNITISDNTYQTSVIMPPNAVVFMKISLQK